MFQVSFQETDPHTGRQGVVTIAGGIWVRDECVFEFAETVFGTSGTIRCDWRQPSPRFEVSEGPANAPGAQALFQKMSQLFAAFHTGAFAGVTDDDLQRLYKGDYHDRHGYSGSTDVEQQRKAHLADLVIQLTRPRKVLVAGCSAGECVRQLRARGIEAWGFDICDDLLEIAYPDVRPFVRVGSVTDIPFGPEDGFDTLTGFDLFEHVPEDRVSQMVAELDRLGVQHVAALIALCEFQYDGHVTLRPLSWWDARMAPAFGRRQFEEASMPMRVVVPQRPDFTQILRVFQRCPTAILPPAPQAEQRSEERSRLPQRHV